MRTSRTIVFTAILAVVLFWLLDVAIDVWGFGQGTFGGQLFAPGRQDLTFRVVVTVVILGAGVLWWRNARDVDRFRASLLSSEARYRALVEASPEGVIAHRGDRPLYANRRAREFVGLDRDQAAAVESLYDFIHPDDHAVAAELLARARREGRPLRCELRVLCPDGEVATVRASLSTVEIDGQPATLTFFRDISDEVDTQRDLLASRERLSLALDAARDGVWDWNIVTGRMVYNRAWAAMLGLDIVEVDDDRTTWRRLVHPDDEERVEALLAAHLRGDLPDYETEVRLRHSRGHYIWVLDRGRVVERDENGAPVRMTGTHRDITARKEAQIALEVRNRLAEIFLVSRGSDVYDAALELLREVTESPAGLFLTAEPGGDLRLAATHHPHAKPEQRNLTGDDLSPLIGSVIESERAVIHRGPSELACCGHRVTDALAVPVLNRDQVLGILLVADRSEPYATADRVLMESLAGYMAPILQSHLTNEATEAQLRQSQKMEAIGVLAGGIAHDFNNILQAILGFTSLAREEAPPGSTLASDLDRVLSATDRGRELVRRILLFSRQEDQRVGPIDVRDVTGEVLDLLRPTVPAVVRLEPRIAGEECLVSADAGQIGQVLLNLATNALHAMETGGGVLTIRVDRRAGGDASDLPENLRGGDVVEIEVVDTGLGMDRAMLDRLYDPFFTTKDVGKGTGLGLSVVHGIVTAHGGVVRIDSEPGVGTRVTVLLPGLGATPAPRAVGARTGRVLVIESDRAAAAVADTFLGRAGHAVTLLSDRDAALAAIDDRPADFDLVLTGVRVPGGNGLEIAEAAARAGLPVIMTAGRGDRAPAAGGTRPAHVAAVVPKPLNTAVLGRVVERALSGESPTMDSPARG